MKSWFLRSVDNEVEALTPVEQGTPSIVLPIVPEIMTCIEKTTEDHRSASMLSENFHSFLVLIRVGQWGNANHDKDNAEY